MHLRLSVITFRLIGCDTADIGRKNIKFWPQILRIASLVPPKWIRPLWLAPTFVRIPRALAQLPGGLLVYYEAGRRSEGSLMGANGAHLAQKDLEILFSDQIDIQDNVFSLFDTTARKCHI